ncbi:dihydroneopterin aldolase [Leeia sp.]|uniref:dihydroneopterin aldolase n=1 Tax=Leeia sp. TaxID=2884678 RepID=UPI0035B2443D
MRKLFFRNLRLMASIGFYQHERLRRQTVHINLEVELDDQRLPADDVQYSLDYDYLRDGVVALVKSRHFNLQESLVESIVDLCFTRPEVRAVCVSSAKLEAYSDVEAVGVEIRTSRAEWQGGA